MDPSMDLWEGMPPEEGNLVVIRFRRELSPAARQDFNKWQAKYDPNLGVEGITELVKLLRTGQYSDLVMLALDMVTGIENNLGDSGLSILTDAMKEGYTPNLLELNLSSHYLTTVDPLAAVIEKGSLRTLKNLSVSYNDLRVSSIARLVKSLAMAGAPKLRLLDLQATTTLDVNVLSDVVRAGALEEVQELYLPKLVVRSSSDLLQAFLHNRLSMLNVLETRWGNVDHPDMDDLLNTLQTMTQVSDSSVLKLFEALTDEPVYLVGAKCFLEQSRQKQDLLTKLSADEGLGDPTTARVVLCGYGTVGKSSLRGAFEMANFANLWTLLEKGSPVKHEVPPLVAVEDDGGADCGDYPGGSPPPGGAENIRRSSTGQQFVRSLFCCQCSADESMEADHTSSPKAPTPSKDNANVLRLLLDPDKNLMTRTDDNGFKSLEEAGSRGMSFEDELWRLLQVKIQHDIGDLRKWLKEPSSFSEQERDSAFQTWMGIRQRALGPIPRTVGAAVATVEVKDPQLRLSIWDMAGQPEFHIFQSIFLPDVSDGALAGKACTFLLVVKGSLDTDSDSAQDTLRYWLRFIAANAVTTSKRRVVVVVNCHGEEVEWVKDIWEEEVRDQLHSYATRLEVDSRVRFVNTVTGRGVLALFKELADDSRAILDQAQKTVPHTCVTVLDKLPRLAADRIAAPIVDLETFAPLIFDGWAIADAAGKKELARRLDLAVRYLHDVGQLILLRQETTGLNGDYVVLSPAWVCEHVVGNLLMPPEIRAAQDAGALRQLAPKKGVVLRRRLASRYQSWLNERQRKYPTPVPDKSITGDVPDKITGEWLVKLVESLKLCFDQQSRDGEEGSGGVLIPALLREDSTLAVRGAWDQAVQSALAAGATPFLAGRRLTCKRPAPPKEQPPPLGQPSAPEPEMTFLSPSLFALLQARLAYHKDLDIAKALNYDFGKTLILIRPLNGVAVLLEYDEVGDNYIDVLGFATKADVEEAQVLSQVMRVVREVRLECSSVRSGSMNLGMQVIRPWKLPQPGPTNVSAFWDRGDSRTDSGPESPPVTVKMQRRDARDVEKLKADVQVHGGRATLSLGYLLAPIDQGSVEVVKLLSEKELNEVQGNLADDLKPLVNVLADWIPPPVSSAPVKDDKRFSPGENELLRQMWSLKADMAEVLSVVKQQTKMIEQILTLVKAGKEELELLRRGQESLLERVAELRRSVDSHDAWPSFAYVAAKEGGGLIRRTKELFAQAHVLRVHCDSYTPRGAHLVEDQTGYEFTMTREWAQKAGPWLSWSVFILSVSLKTGVKFVLPGLEALIPSVEQVLGDGPWSKGVGRMFAGEVVKALGGAEDDTLVRVGAEKLMGVIGDAVNQEMKKEGVVLDAKSLKAGGEEARAAASGAFQVLGKQAAWDSLKFEKDFGLQKKKLEDGRVAWLCAACRAANPAVEIAHTEHKFF